MLARPRRTLAGLVCWAAAVALGTPASAQAPATTDPVARSGPAPGQVLSLPAAIDLALRQNPSLRAADDGRVAAMARVPLAQAPYYPRFDWVSSATRSQVFASSVNRTVLSTSLISAVEGRQLLTDFGKTAAAVDEARAGLRAFEADFERVRETVVFNVRQAYYTLLRARRLVRVAEASLARAELNLRSARGFFEVGTKPKSDVSKAEVEVANARVLLIRARNNVRIAVTSLANVLGLSASVPIEIEDVLGHEPVTLDPQALLAEAMQQRPELVQAAARLDQARAQLEGARAGFRPEISVNAAYGSSSSDLPLRERWAIGLTVSWNLFQGFATTSRIQETTALVQVARSNAETLELQVRLEVEQAYIGLTEAQERIAATATAVESATENLRLAQGRYDAGVGTILELTEAQLSLRNAEADEIIALTDHKLGLAALDRSLGRP